MNLDEVKLLVVGAGGIGCELLKNLVLTGFSQIEVIDLDTIELSNLNRQFLFQKVHVGKPKAIIARESVLKYNPKANIVAFHDSIMNVKYNVEYFKHFSLVLNALDNKAARSHVNRLCLAADVPLIESGSGGYLGQITLIKRGLTECYDCLPKPPAKSFPGCTIRNTPSEPIHCIVWAKHLFNQLFGAEDPDQDVSPDAEDPENMADAGKSAVEKTSLEEVKRKSTREWAKETNYDPIKLFNKLFSEDIKYLLSMANLWEKRKPPKPLDWTECINDETIPQTEQQNSTNNSTSVDQAKLASHKILSIKEISQLFHDSVDSLRNKLQQQQASTSNDENDSCEILVWDKDDDDSMNFVTAASNLRSFIFSISAKSKFETKSLAGNIIPAIATTNAIVSGLIVLQALKVLENKYDKCKTVYLRDKPSQNKLIVSTQLVKPNEKCYVCASKPEITIKLNLNTFTIKQFETKILKQELNMVQPDVEIDDGSGRIILSSEEGETEENNDKPFAYFGLTDQSSVKCDDFFQNYQIKITFIQCDQLDAQTGKDYELMAQNQMLKDIQEQIQKDQTSSAGATTSAAAAAADATAASADIVETLNTDKPSSSSLLSLSSVNSVESKQQTASNQEEKKRSYQTAFEEDEDASTNVVNLVETNSTKKLKPSSTLNNENSQEILIDETNSTVQPAPAPAQQQQTAIATTTTTTTNDDVTVKPSINNNNQIIDQDDILCSSNSINDASDALSDEEQAFVPKGPKSNELLNKYHNKSKETENQIEEILVDDDVIIEEDDDDDEDDEDDEDDKTNNNNNNINNKNKNRDENDYYNSSSYDHNASKNYINNRSNNNSVNKPIKQIDSSNFATNNTNTNSNDDDIIECTSDEDVIEINDDETGPTGCDTESGDVISSTDSNHSGFRSITIGSINKKIRLLESNGNNNSNSNINNNSDRNGNSNHHSENVKQDEHYSDDSYTPCSKRISNNHQNGANHQHVEPSNTTTTASATTTPTTTATSTSTTTNSDKLNEIQNKNLDDDFITVIE